MTPAGSESDFHRRVASFEKNLHLIVAPGQVAELRAPSVSTPGYRYPHAVSGYFDDIHKLAVEAARFEFQAKGIYTTLNPVDPALLARAANRAKVISDQDPLTADSDILKCTTQLPTRPTL